MEKIGQRKHRQGGQRKLLCGHSAKLLMRAYLELNVYISYLLGQRREELIERILGRGIECAFIIVASRVVFAEIGMRCHGRGDLLLKKTLDDFKKAGKITLVGNERELDLEASRLNEETNGVFGLNDFAHRG